MKAKRKEKFSDKLKLLESSEQMQNSEHQVHFQEVSTG
jgi:hypothetical protein